ncbi:MAG: TonB family protein [Steroidobacteraceae bacterium]|nr:TonB family protein [Steroidobacteraceae bacterium]
MRGLLVCAISALCPLAAVGEPADPELTAALQVGCVVPTTAVAVPAGAFATEAEMVATASSFKARDAEATTYARCVNDAAARMLVDAALPEPRRSAVQAAQGELIDAAIVPVERIAADFNRQLRCFRGRELGVSSCMTPAALPPGSTPPKPIHVSRRAASAMGNCYPVEARSDGNEGQLMMLVLVGEDGTVKKTQLPEGIVDWQRKAADCLAGKMRYEPARLADGKPFPAVAIVPITFSLASDLADYASVVYSKLASTEEEMAQIHRSCYPVELLPSGLSGEVLYRVRLSALGRVTKLELLRSSGDTRIDEAGRCIVEGYEFEPARRGGRPLVSTFPWSVKVLPPKP